MAYLAYLIPEGVPASDGRTIAEGALTWREGKLPLMATDEIGVGHDGATFVGNLVKLRREEVDGTTWVLADVEWDEDDDSAEAQRLVDEGKLYGISADIAVDLRGMRPPPIVEDEEEELAEQPDRPVSDDGMTLLHGEILGGTIVPHPAFAEAKIAVTASGFMATWTVAFGIIFAKEPKLHVPADARSEAGRGLNWRRSHRRGGSSVSLRIAQKLVDDECDEATCHAMRRWFSRNSDVPTQDGFKEGQQGHPSNGRIAWALHGGNAGRAWVNQLAGRNVASELVASLTAAAVGKTNLPVAALDRPWDASAAKARMAARAGGADNLNAAQFAQGFLYRVDGEDPTNIGSYKLPFADVIDGTLTTVPRGVYAAAGALSGSRGGVDVGSSRGAVASKACSLYAAVRRAYPNDDVPDCPLTASVEAQVEVEGEPWMAARGIAENPDAPPAEDLIAEARGRLVAHAGQGVPDAAPKEAFEDPELEEATPFTVTHSGMLFGHLGLRDSCHIGFADQCVTIPLGCDYDAYFHTGDYDTADGTRIRVGRITMDGDHASLNDDWKKASNHYANTLTVVGYVRVGEDGFGVWVAGALAPGVDEVTVRRLQGCGGLSGDWRSIDGKLQLVAALAVNSGGFPVPRLSVTADGQPKSLVAAGFIPADLEPVTVEPSLVELDRTVSTLRRQVAALRAELMVATLND